jgi:probable phosphoglycerate mutase
MTGKRLYGRSEGVSLSDEGRAQAERLAERMRGLRLTAIYSSPLDRCRETAAPIAEGRRLEVRPLEGVLEIDYGTFTGRSFPSLRRTKLWRQIHGMQPSAVRFPGGETLAEAQRRSVDAVTEVAERHPKGTVAIVTHGDVISLVIAHLAGVHVDLFQRIEVAPASVSAVAVGGGVPKVRRVNDTGSLEDLGPPPQPPPRVRG